MPDQYVEVFSTTADIGIRIAGRGFQGFYDYALKGLAHLYYGDQLPRFEGPEKAVPFQYRGDGCENVLVNLLAEAVYLLQNEERFTTSIVVKEATDTYLDADLITIPCLDAPELEIKSVTYHNLTVLDRDGLKTASVVFDV